jgi:phage baseplate assembly protein V
MSDADRAVRRAVTRGKVTGARTRAGRVLVDLTLLDGEARRGVELLLPTGFSALPGAGSDVVVFEVGANRQHLVAMVADNPALRIEGLGAGEFGMRDAAGQQVVFRADRVEITGALRVDITASGPVNVTTPGTATIDAARVNLGAGATQPVRLADNSNATKVFAI